MTALTQVVDDDGKEIGIVEVVVLRLDVEHLDLFEQRPRRSLNGRVPELTELGLSMPLAAVLHEGESRVSLLERQKYFTRKDQVCDRG